MERLSARSQSKNVDFLDPVFDSVGDGEMTEQTNPKLSADHEHTGTRLAGRYNCSFSFVILGLCRDLVLTV